MKKVKNFLKTFAAVMTGAGISHLVTDYYSYTHEKEIYALAGLDWKTEMYHEMAIDAALYFGIALLSVASVLIITAIENKKHKL